ncbi:UNVERIFIED_ORG: hypothetical protein QQG_0812 [Clostridioides difficile Y384]
MAEDEERNHINIEMQRAFERIIWKELNIILVVYMVES